MKQYKYKIKKAKKKDPSLKPKDILTPEEYEEHCAYIRDQNKKAVAKGLHKEYYQRNKKEIIRKNNIHSKKWKEENKERHRAYNKAYCNRHYLEKYDDYLKKSKINRENKQKTIDDILNS